MDGQMTIFDFLKVNPTYDDLEIVLKGGSQYEGGKIRIFALHQVEPDAIKRAKWLSKEYGLGGRSVNLPCDRRGFADFDGKGVKIWGFNFDGETVFTWKEADAAIKRLLDAGQYMTDEDMDRWNALNIDRDNIPYPEPAYRYPPEKGDE